MPLLCSTLCPDAHTAAVVAGERVHASAIAPDLDVRVPLLSSRTPSNLPGAVSGFASPFSFLGARSSSSGQNRAKSPSLVAPANPRRPTSIRRTPSCATSPRSSTIPPRARPCPTPTEIEHRPPPAIVDLRQAPLRAPPLPSTTPFRPSSAQNRSTVSPAATLAHSPTLSLSESALRRPRIAAAPPQNAPSAARAAAGSPWAPPLAAAARPRAA